MLITLLLVSYTSTTIVSNWSPSSKDRSLSLSCPRVRSFSNLATVAFTCSIPSLYSVSSVLNWFSRTISSSSPPLSWPWSWLSSLSSQSIVRRSRPLIFGWPLQLRLLWPFSPQLPQILDAFLRAPLRIRFVFGLPRSFTRIGGLIVWSEGRCQGVSHVICPNSDAPFL